jgi:ABC-type glycerol-3-phosphate transport system permease component
MTTLATSVPRGAAIRRRLSIRPIRIVLFVLMAAGSCVMFYPFLFMIDTSLKSQSQYLAGSGHSLISWGRLFAALPVGQELTNSTLVSALSLAIIVALSSTAGYAFAKLRYRGGVLVFLGIVSAMLIPMQSIIIPAYVNLSQFGLLDSYWGAVLLYAALGTPFATFLMTAFYRSLPDELVEAAIVDGLGYVSIYRRIALPLSTPAIATVAVLQFIQIWDDLLVGLLFLQNSDERTITVGLGVLSAGRVTDIPVLMAGSLLSAIPAVVVYLVLQRYLVSGLTAGIGK